MVKFQTDTDRSSEGGVGCSVGHVLLGCCSPMNIL